MIKPDWKNVIGDGKGKSYNVKFFNSSGMAFDVDVTLGGEITKEVFIKESKKAGMKIISMKEIP